MENGATAVGEEVFALTDEQIVGLGPEEGATEENPNAETQRSADRRGNGADQSKPAEQEGRRGRVGEVATRTAASEPHEAPPWLAEKMRDPWCGDEAKELWDGKQKAEAEAAAYREVFATAEDARALKEIYPGGVAEAKSAAERARELEAIDAAFYRGDAAARTQLAQRLMQQDPAAFREMVQAGLALLRPGAQETPALSKVQQAPDGANSSTVESRTSPSSLATSHSPLPTEVTPEVVRAYGEFEKAANADLEKSVGGAIARVIEDALPNLRWSGAREGAHGAAPLRDRLGNAVREEVDAALRSDRALGEQVARVLAGRRFDAETRAQVVRLIDARAQQLVPGAVKRVVGSWTSATLGARGKREDAERTPAVTPTRAPKEAARAEKPATRREAPTRGRRPDYGRLTDEDILGL
ncbi:MAG TPA: hypothetical protein VMU53_11975 [Candidatus Sulfotelmatobacter sp.]|nr:hypothetical protein [Candidatus Sulfotelmatobacter sp.]